MSKFRIVLGLAGMLTLVACGGGSSDPAAVTPTPTPTPPPTPPPPSGSVFDTAEFQQNPGLALIGALNAYEDGVTGTGIIVAVIDTGIDIDHLDLDANIHPASRDIIGSRNSLNDTNGHGTFVAGFAVAEKNDIGSHGVAFNAQVLALRTDDPGSCTANPGDCSFFDSDLATATDFAISQGVRVINFSLGGSAANATLRAAIGRAVDAGIIVVISAGNDGNANPEPFSLIATDAIARGRVIIAGSIDTGAIISSFSNRAGTGQQFYLLAPGEDVLTTGINDTLVVGSGTSFAAPHIAGAIALLIEKFPALTADQLIQILWDSAVDLGATGVDAVNGRGLLDIGKAINPLGTFSYLVQTVEGVQQVNVELSGVELGPAFGDALTGPGPFRDTIFLDGFDRAYVSDIAGRVRARRGSLNIDQRLDSFRRWKSGSISLAAGNTLSVATQQSSVRDYETATGLGLFEDEANQFDRTRLTFSQSLSEKTTLAVGYGASINEVFSNNVRLRQGLGADPFLGSGANTNPLLFSYSGDGQQYAVTHRLSDQWNLQVGFGTEEIQYGYSPVLPDRHASTDRLTIAAAIDRVVAHGRVGVEAGFIREKGSVLESRSAGALQFGTGAETSFISAKADWALNDRLSVFGQATTGTTQVQSAENSLIGDVTDLRLSHFRAGFAVEDALRPNARFAFGVSQPLRAESGSVSLILSDSYDYWTEEVGFSTRSVGLAPSGRELDLEMSYETPITSSFSLYSNLVYQVNPGHSVNEEQATTFMLRGRASF